MFPLKLPDYGPKTRKEGFREEIFCVVRKKYVALTPEEWVRQHFLNLLIDHLGYPKGMVRLEHAIKYFKNAKRSDITVMDRGGEVFLLVECKSFDVSLDQKTLSQVATYNKVFNAQYLAITNGLTHFVWRKDEYRPKQLKEFPIYP